MKFKLEKGMITAAFYDSNNKYSFMEIDRRNGYFTSNDFDKTLCCIKIQRIIKLYLAILKLNG